MENKNNVKAPDAVIDKSGKEFKAVNPNDKKEKEKKAKQNGTWLKNKDGSTFDGDPRSWV